MREIYLQPGDQYFGSGQIRLVTLLGSCISTLLWHEGRRLGGMNHFMLPTRVNRAEDGFEGRYADESFALFRRQIEAENTAPGEYRVLLFGGANMFSTEPSDRINVGERNIRAARSLLPKHGFIIKHSDVGGIGYRKLSFDLFTGEVSCTQVNARRDCVTTGKIQFE